MSLISSGNSGIFGRGITARNVNEALAIGMPYMRDYGVLSGSRGLATIRIPGPFMTIYRNPWERVLFDNVRDANPFFHLFESLWILAGSDTVALPAFFLPRVKQYSDNGERFHGAYGHRLRHWGHFTNNGKLGFDQLQYVIDLLCDKPDTRQAVVSIWDPEKDLGAETKDMPCNDMIMFDIVGNKLNMTVCNRSNDMIWGAYGANAVQFSVIQEYVAASVGVGIGYYTQMSNNFHVYLDNPYWLKWNESSDVRAGDYNANSYDYMTVQPMCSNATEAATLRADAELLNQLAEGGCLEGALDFYCTRFRNEFVRTTVLQMLTAYIFYKRGNYKLAIDAAERIVAPDWRGACVAWLVRRATKKAGAV
jgi:thymidylate synthase